MEDDKANCRSRSKSDKDGLPITSALRLIIANILLLFLTLCSGCALRFETVGGDSWSMGLTRYTIKLQPLDKETSLAKENSQFAPIEFGIVPLGIEAAFGNQQQARGFVLANTVTNRFLSPSGAGIGNVNGWHFGFIHYRIPRDHNHVRLLANTVKGAAVRIANGNPHLKIGVSQITMTTVLEDPASGKVEYKISSPPDFNYSVQPTDSP